VLFTIVASGASAGRVLDKGARFLNDGLLSLRNLCIELFEPVQPFRRCFDSRRALCYNSWVGGQSSLFSASP